MADLLSVARLVRLAVPGCPEPVINDAIIEVAIEFCRMTRAVNEAVSIVTVAGTATYAIATSAGTRAFRVERVERGAIPLERSNRIVFDASTTLRAAGQPTHYYLNDDSLTLGPIPSSVETLSVLVTVEPVFGSTTLPDVLVNDWRRVIAAGAKAMLLATPKASWQSPTDAATEYAAFMGGIEDAIAKRDAGGSGYVPRASPVWC